MLAKPNPPQDSGWKSRSSVSLPPVPSPYNLIDVVLHSCEKNQACAHTLIMFANIMRQGCNTELILRGCKLSRFWGKPRCCLHQCFMSRCFYAVFSFFLTWCLLSCLPTKYSARGLLPGTYIQVVFNKPDMWSHAFLWVFSRQCFSSTLSFMINDSSLDQWSYL